MQKNVDIIQNPLDSQVKSSNMAINSFKWSFTWFYIEVISKKNYSNTLNSIIYQLRLKKKQFKMEISWKLKIKKISIDQLIIFPFSKKISLFSSLPLGLSSSC